MNIKYIAHSCFLLTTETGNRILLDPFDDFEGFSKPVINAETAVVSHNHGDHAAYSLVSGSCEVISGSGKHFSSGVNFEAFPALHGSPDRTWNGEVNCYKFETDGIKYLHLSDMGEPFDDETIKKIGPIDLLFVPIGSYYTLCPARAYELSVKIGAKVTIPMHFYIPGQDREKYPLKSLEDFISGKRNVKHIRTGETDLTLENLPKTPEIWAMTPQYY
ncbi:MAG: MBL fold metallo-hydrolase [Firmicutes bacterium]|nr:MBL fold metallo-hydrolase [Bacillota bacterium]